VINRFGESEGVLDRDGKGSVSGRCDGIRFYGEQSEIFGMQIHQYFEDIFSE
jgi:hypothetical protein